MSRRSFFFGILAVWSALPSNEPNDPIISALGGKERFQHMPNGNGTLYLVDTWLKVSDLQESERYTPDTENVYHLFTRSNPTTSQTLLLGASGLLQASNFDPTKRTIVFIHGWICAVTGRSNQVLVPAFLAAEDVNMISVDWRKGGGTPNYVAAVVNTVTSGKSAARFIDWLNKETGSTLAQYHILGHSLGAHMAGIIARNVDGRIPYITALDPASPGWSSNSNALQKTDADYVEVIHTNGGLVGYLTPLGHTDFYPNGGISMPGCESQSCDHSRCYFYIAESLVSGDFVGTECPTYVSAVLGKCELPGRLAMGGLKPKTGVAIKSAWSMKLVTKELAVFSLKESASLQRGNAASLLGTMPRGPYLI